jgi:hypothetical protein
MLHLAQEATILIQAGASGLGQSFASFDGSQINVTVRVAMQRDATCSRHPTLRCALRAARNRPAGGSNEDGRARLARGSQRGCA